MVSQKQLYQDIEKICTQTNATYVCYNNVHIYGENGEPIMLPAFIEKAKELMGPKVSSYLYNSGIIRQQLGGDYDFKVPFEVMDGGGMSYNKIGSEDGHDYRIIYFFDDKTVDDQYNIYHELGHLTQFELNLFNNKELHKIYSFMNKGVSRKPLSFKKLGRKFIEGYKYQEHLLETHANAFATTCLLLRCDGKAERIKQSFDCYIRAGNTFFEGMTDEEKEYPAMKYYSALPVQKAVIREVNRWFNNGEIKKYKDANGDIDFLAVAQKTHDIVLEHDYSPRTFSQFLNQDIKALHPTDEQGWRHSVPEALVARAYKKLFHKERERYLKERTDLHETRDFERKIERFKPLREHDTTAKNLNICCRLDNCLIDLQNSFDCFDIEISDYDELDLFRSINCGGIPRSVINVISKRMAKQHNIMEEEAQILLGQYRINLNRILKKPHNKDDINNIMDTMNRPNGRNLVWDMYYARLENPRIDLPMQDIPTFSIERTKKQRLKDEGRIFKQVRDIVVHDFLEDCTEITPQNRSRIQQQLLHKIKINPDICGSRSFTYNLTSKFDNQQTKDNIKNCLNNLHCLYYMDPELFAKSVNRYYKTLCNSCEVQKAQTSSAKQKPVYAQQKTR